jgi:hypothetical protein
MAPAWHGATYWPMQGAADLKLPVDMSISLHSVLRVFSRVQTSWPSQITSTWDWRLRQTMRLPTATRHQQMARHLPSPGRCAFCMVHKAEQSPRTHAVCHHTKADDLHVQANRGLLVKGKVSTEGVSAAMAVKAW